MASNDSIVERAEHVEHALHTVNDPAAQVAVGGPCPSCGDRVETVLRVDSTSVTCDSCGSQFPVAA